VFRNKDQLKYGWEKVKVTNYSIEDNKYEIIFEDNFTKSVDRLGLIFKADDPLKFITRVERAR